MIALFSRFAIIVTSIVVVRIGAVALELTGIPPEVAAFQAQSAVRFRLSRNWQVPQIVSRLQGFWGACSQNFGDDTAK